ncbi:serine/threonine-protein kinase [Actinocorallia sp. B10E7]|uniref:serine/threonine-protein kinase n=1 Tax=Actinocorallia sp. B10E7 TaxID=3153558 RepID=UPI00325F2EB3
MTRTGMVQAGIVTFVPPEKIIADRYLLVELLGRGGMGAVWRAHDRLLGREVALKEVSPPPGVNPAPLYARIIREARAAARLDHPGIVTVHDVVEEEGRPWIVMRYVRADSLDRVLAERGPLSPEEAASLGLQLLDALRAAHAAGVVHRDVKPANVLMEGGRAVLTDFGIASLAGDPELTRAGALLGSPAYLSPEQARRRPATPMSDLWSLGATLYTAVEGRPPFDRDDLVGVLSALLTEEPDPPRRAGPLAPVLAGLLRKDADTRMRADDAAHLLAAVAGSPNPVRSADTDPGVLPQNGSTRRGGRDRRPVMIAAGAALVLVVGVAVALSPWKDGKPLTPTSTSSVSAPISVPTPGPDEREYKGPLYTVIVPADWTDDGKGTFLAPAAKDGGRIGIVVDSPSTSVGLKQELEAAAAMLDYPDYKRVGDIMSVSYRGQTAYELEFTFTQNGRPAHAKTRIFEFLGENLQVILLADQERWEEGLPAYARFLETIRPS